VVDSAFADLRRLADWFEHIEAQRSTIALTRLTQRVGAAAIPLLGRQLANDAARRHPHALA
jgi:hypothetical protein